MSLQRDSELVDKRVAARTCKTMSELRDEHVTMARTRPSPANDCTGEGSMERRRPVEAEAVSSHHSNSAERSRTPPGTAGPRGHELWLAGPSRLLSQGLGNDGGPRPHDVPTWDLGRWGRCCGIDRTIAVAAAMSTNTDRRSTAAVVAGQGTGRTAGSARSQQLLQLQRMEHCIGADNDAQAWANATSK